MGHSVTLIEEEYRQSKELPSRVEFKTWMADLTSPKIRDRQRAREQLVRMGEAAVAPLLDALTGRDIALRREAARTLSEIGSTALIPIWLDMLEDEDCDFRWFAIKGLIATGEDAVVPLLRDLERRSDSILFRDGARRVLHALARGALAPILAPVLSALDDIEPALGVLVPAFEACGQLQIRRSIVENK